MKNILFYSYTQNGAIPDHHSDWVISLGFTSTVPGDPGLDLSEDASDDLLNALVGFYTDLGITSKLLSRDVTYTPLPSMECRWRQAGSGWDVQ